MPAPVNPGHRACRRGRGQRSDDRRNGAKRRRPDACPPRLSPAGSAGSRLGRRRAVLPPPILRILSEVVFQKRFCFLSAKLYNGRRSRYRGGMVGPVAWQ
jgi:hypothetical protein